MTLRVEHIKLSDFRSYESFALSNVGRLTVLVGPNAAGKTNVVEAVQVLTALTSFRHATIEQMVRRGASCARLGMHVTDGNRSLDVDCHLEGRTRKYRLNEKPRRPADLKGLVPSVTFTPDDLDMVKGPMSTRRQCIDVLGSQLNAGYYLVRKDYEKVVRHKNKLLKEDASRVLIESINEMVVMCGAQLTCYRVALLRRMAEHMSMLHNEISGGRESLRVEYVPSWENVSRETFERETWLERDLTRDAARGFLEESLSSNAAEEIRRKRCLAGPHLDQVRFYINDMDATQFGSQGQQRSIVLAEKLAEAAVIEDILGKKPVLLLDDVMSELDGQRREALVSYISRDVQTFITTANISYFDAEMLNVADVVEIPLSNHAKHCGSYFENENFAARGKSGYPSILTAEGSFELDCPIEDDSLVEIGAPSATLFSETSEGISALADDEELTEL